MIFGDNNGFNARQVEITIDSIDLKEVNLLEFKRSWDDLGTVYSKISINISRSTIYLSSRRFNFIHLYQTDEVYIQIHDCVFKSPFIIVDSRIMNNWNYWLRVEMDMASSRSRIEIKNTNISAGRFYITNIQIFNMVECRIENYIPKIETPLKLPRNQYAIFVELFPDLLDETLSINSTLLGMELMGTIMHFDDISRFNIEKCTFQHLISHKMIEANGVFGTIKNTHLLNSIVLDRLIEIKGGAITFFDVKIQYFPLESPSAVIFFILYSTITMNQLQIASIAKISKLFYSDESSIEVNGISITDLTFISYLFDLIETKMKINELRAFKVQSTAEELMVAICNLRLSEIYISHSSIIDSKIYGIGFSMKDHSLENPSLGGSSLASFDNVSFINIWIERSMFTSHREGDKIILNNVNIEGCKSFLELFALENFATLKISNTKITNTSTFREVITFVDQGILEMTNFSLTKSQIHFRQAFNLPRKANLTSFEIRESTFTGDIFTQKSMNFMIQKKQAFINGLNIINTTMENVLVSYDSNVQLSNFQMIDVKFPEAIPEETFYMNVFRLHRSTINIQDLEIKHCSIDIYLVQLKHSELTITNARIDENEFSTMLEASNSKLYLRNFHAKGNRANRLTKLLKVTSSSSVNLSNVSISVPRLSITENLIDIRNSEINFNKVNLIIRDSSSLLLETLKFVFNKLGYSSLRNLTVQCPIHFNALTKKQELDNSLSISCRKCEKDNYPTSD